jgi:aerobic-type carbon monoxide dehydrogenase small subunit (CoxS/CutS family)
MTINGQICSLMVEPRMTLLGALREELALTGTKKGCDRSEYATCRSPLRSCYDAATSSTASRARH